MKKEIINSEFAKYFTLSFGSAGLFGFATIIYAIRGNELLLGLMGEELSSHFFNTTKQILFPNWFLYNLPDFLWLFSFNAFLLILWYKSKYSYILLIVTLLLAIALEFFQYFNIINGTFCPIDLQFYLLAFILSFLILIKLRSHRYENKYC
uniref:Uncharacterized protein n=1 Tax=Ignavibacterium album TaxID=591197 RepID=A0A7V2ZKC6_9BACT